MARKVEVEIVGDASSLHRAFSAIGKESRSLGSSFAHAGKMAGFLAGGAALGGLAVTLKTGIDEFTEATKVSAQTAAVLKSTGGAAGVTADQVDKLAGSLMQKSGMDDEAIKSGENLLLTFTNIRNESGKGNDIFNQTTQIMADLSTAMGQDTKTSAIQLGKALNDPATGMTKLQRIGVTFTESQKEAAKHLAATGHVAEAQKIILGELTKEFGGSAEAAGKTLPGQLNILKETFSNVAGEVVSKLIPAFKAIVSWVQEHWPTIEKVIRAVFDGIAWAWEHGVKPAFDAIVEAGKRTVTWFEQNWGEIKKTFLEVFGPMQKVAQRFVDFFDDLFHKRWKEALGDLVTLLGDTLDEAGNLLTHAWDGIGNLGEKLLDKLGLGFLKGAFSTMFDGIKTQWKGFFEIFSGILHGDFGKIFDGVADIITGAAKQLAAPFIAIGETLGKVFEEAFNGVVDFTKWIGDKIKDAVIKGADTVEGWAKDIAGWISKAFLAAIDFAAWVLERIKAALITGANTVEGWAKKIGGWIYTAFTDFIKFGAWVLERIKAAVIAGAETVAGWARTIGKWIYDAFIAFISFGAWVGERIAAAVMSGAETVAGWGKTIGGWLRDAFKGLISFGSWIGDKIGAIGSKIGGALGDAVDTVKGWGSSIAGWIEGAFKGALEIGKWIADKIHDGWDAISKALGWLKSKVVKLIKDLFGIDSPSKVFADFGKYMMQGLAKGIMKTATDPLEAIKWIFKMVGIELPDWLEWPLKLVDAPAKFIEWVAGKLPGIGDVLHAVLDVIKSATSGISTSQVFKAQAEEWKKAGAWPREIDVLGAAWGIAEKQWPYAVGGGHNDSFAPSAGAPHWGMGGSRIGYDCSGAVGAIMHAGGYQSSPMVSGDYMGWGQPGPGKFITTMAIPGVGGEGHVFAVLGGLGWGTGGNNDGGPGWYEHSRDGYTPRHPFGSQGLGSSVPTDAGNRGSGGGRAAQSVSSSGPDAFHGDYFASPGIRDLVARGVLTADDVAGFWRGTSFAPGGVGLVGEKGPELMFIPRGAQIIPNHRLGGSAGGGAGGVLVHTVVQLDRRVLVDAVQEGLIEKSRLNGGVGF